jgi:uncharacterized protein (TIGR02453 family)
MKAQIATFPKAGLDFLSALARNNDKDWFAANRETYEERVKTPMVGLVEAINEELSSFAPAYVAPSPKKAIAPMHRDTRFSADKSPYKTQVSAVFPRKGAKKQEAAGFFFGISPDGIDAVGGAFMPGPPQLDALRRHLADHHAALRAIVADPVLVKRMGKLQGECLKRVPQGYEADHPAGDLLRYKQFYFRTQLDASLAGTAKLLPALSERFRAMTPFVEFLDEALARLSRA